MSRRYSLFIYVVIWNPLIVLLIIGLLTPALKSLRRYVGMAFSGFVQWGATLGRPIFCWNLLSRNLFDRNFFKRSILSRDILFWDVYGRRMVVWPVPHRHLHYTIESRKVL